jgi:pimeloyl-ACP methyl ester carboxylesterase
MEVTDDLRGLSIPAAVLAAEKDDIIPARRTDAVRRVIGNLVLDRTIAGAGHNDLYHRPDFHAAMVEALAKVRNAAAPR